MVARTAGLTILAELDVDPEAFYDLAGAYSLASRIATTALTNTYKAIHDATLMSGNDNSGTLWARATGPRVSKLLSRPAKRPMSWPKMAALTRQSGANHDRSENAEDYNIGKQLPGSDPGAESYRRPLSEAADALADLATGVSCRIGRFDRLISRG
ncbi:hypothetical protein [Nocardia rhizosphaerihabitans]|uniref:Uncharacterized protein n=1 Tax=Nocardia rhizosphaerihabitans TaxID=1691570 RepID=A0ABQ2K5M8_9NOCA|nr:hypothetical protein [Nocardia rhizosphaerihabitans]GGN66339.1 hypothetical protein GCM10011610_01200 [Nocardia rhizosphaerihabitans]